MTARPKPPPTVVRGQVARTALALAWTGALAGLVWALHHLGGGSLSAPPLLDPQRLDQWLAERDTATVAFALVRVVALGLGWYLLAVSVLGALARASRVPRLIRLADAITAPLARRVLATVAGIGLSTGAAGLAAIPVLGGGRPPPPAGTRVTLERLADGSPVELRRLPDDEPEPDTATMRVEQDAGATMRLEDGGDAGEPDPPGAMPPAPTTWTIGPGHSFWSVADAVLAEQWGRPPRDAEILPYWQALIDLNRSRLVQPDNPDLLYDGQRLDLPPAPAPPP